MLERDAGNPEERWSTREVHIKTKIWGKGRCRLQCSEQESKSGNWHWGKGMLLNLGDFLRGLQLDPNRKRVEGAWRGGKSKIGGVCSGGILITGRTGRNSRSATSNYGVFVGREGNTLE